MNLFELFATIGLDSSQYEDGMDSAEKKTESFGNKLKNGLQTASKVAVGAIGAVSAGAVAMTGAFVRGASDLAVYGDNIDKMSQKMGLSAEAYQEWDAILQHSGTSIESLQSGMKTLANAVENGNDAFERLGITQEQIASMNNEELFSATIAALQNVDNETERTYLAGQLLGRGATELGALLNTSAEDTEAMRQRVHDLGGVMSDEAVKSSAAFQDSLQDMKTAFSGIKRGITSDMLPGLTSLMDGFTSLIIGEEGAEKALQSGFDGVLNSITKGVTKISSVGKKIIPMIVSAVISNLPTLASSVIEMIQVIGDTIIENLPILIESALTILQSIGASLIENLPVILESLTQAMSQIALMLSDPETMSMLLETILLIITTLATSIMENLPLLIDTTLQVIDNIVAFIVENLPMFLDTAVQIIMALVDGFMAALPELVAYLPEIIDNITTTLLDMLPMIIETGVTLLTALINDLPTIITTIVGKMPEIINNIVSTLTTLIPQIVKAGVTVLTAIITNMPKIITTIVDALPEIITSIVTGLLDMLPDIIQAGVDLLTALVTNLPQIILTLVGKMPEIIAAIVKGLIDGIPEILKVGVKIIEGLWDGIKSAVDWLWEKIKGVFGGVIDFAKKIFGIHSPSKVFAGIGEMLDKGMAEGLEDYAGLAVDAAEDMANDVFDATNRDFDFTANGTVNPSSATAGRSIVINVYGAEGQDVEELAEIISQKIAFGYTQERAVFA